MRDRDRKKKEQLQDVVDGLRWDICLIGILQDRRKNEVELKLEECTNLQIQEV